MNIIKKAIEPSAILSLSSIAQTERHPEKTSERYGFIPTMEILKTLGECGLVPVSAQQSSTRNEENHGYQKHVVRMRFADQVGNLNVDDEIAELLLVNSHMGSSSFQLMLGMHRCVCRNQLVVKSSSLAEYRILHNKDALENAANAAISITRSLPDIVNNVSEFKSITLSEPEQKIFAESAIPLRFDPEVADVMPERVLRVNRRADMTPTLWNTFNTVQENLIKGGVVTHSHATNTRRRSSQVKSIDQNLKINTALWALTEKMAELKTMQ